MKLQKASSARYLAESNRVSINVLGKEVESDCSPHESRDGTGREKNAIISADLTSASLQQGLAPVWKASKHGWTIIIIIAIVSLMVALDATILVTVLPVFLPPGNPRIPS